MENSDNPTTTATTTTTTTATPATGDLSRRELRDRIVELETRIEILNETLDEKNERIQSLESELDELKQQEGSADEEASNTLSGFSDGEVEQARTIAKDVRKAVVTIESDRGSGGTAWFLDTGDLITNSHVVDGSSSFECWTVGGESFRPELVGSSDYMNQPYHDVAVLKADFSPVNTLPLGDSSALQKDQPLIQVGHPFAIGDWVVSIGKYVDEGYGDAVLTSVPNLSGNSGSPLTTLDGAVVGITTGGVPRKSDTGTQPQPEELKLYDEFDDYQWGTHDKTSVIRKYVEQFG